MQRIVSTVDALTLPNAVATVSHRLAPTPPPWEDQIAFCGGMIGGNTRWGKAARATTKLPNSPLAAKWDGEVDKKAPVFCSALSPMDVKIPKAWVYKSRFQGLAAR